MQELVGGGAHQRCCPSRSPMFRASLKSCTLYRMRARSLSFMSRIFAVRRSSLASWSVSSAIAFVIALVPF